MITDKKFLTYKKACSSPLYIAVRDRCVDILTDPKGPSSFQKDAVLVYLQYDAIEFRWDHIRHMIEAPKEEGGYDCELIPLASSYFKRWDKDHPPASFPGRYMALGSGKRTVGYASAVRENGHFVFKVLEQKRSVAKGCVASHDKTVRTASNQHVLTVLS